MLTKIEFVIVNENRDAISIGMLAYGTFTVDEMDMLTKIVRVYGFDVIDCSGLTQKCGASIGVYSHKFIGLWKEKVGTRCEKI